MEAALALLKPGGRFVVKVMRGGAEADLLRTLQGSFRSVEHAKPAASRKDSAELYVVAKGFRPPP
jgi:23S rRNA (uridine2552-2'-O)-methyltransferase